MWRFLRRQRPFVALLADRTLLFQAGEEERRLPLDEIDEITLTRGHEYNIDTLAITIRAADAEVSFTEDATGFHKTMDALVLDLPGFDRDWFTRAIQAPFDEACTLFQR